MQSIAGIPYDSNMPWPFWFLIGEIVSKAFFSDEGRLEWLNAVRVRTREFIAFTNIQSNRVSNQDKTDIEEAKLQVVEVDFSRPQPGEALNLFWKPARPIISKKVQDCECIEVSWISTSCLIIFANRARLFVNSRSRR
jgi:hypothetical protein